MGAVSTAAAAREREGARRGEGQPGQTAVGRQRQVQRQEQRWARRPSGVAPRSGPAFQTDERGRVTWGQSARAESPWHPWRGA